MINVLQRLSELDEGNPRVEKSMTQVQALAMTGDGIRHADVYMEEPDMASLRALSGLKESKEIVECGMPGMGAPMPTMPTTINMSAPTGSELVGLIRGIMDLAGGDVPNAHMDAPPANVDSMIGHEPLVAEPEHAMAHSVPAAGVSGPTFGDESGEDELADMIRKIKTGEPVKISTDMPVKVSSDNPIKASTSDKLNVKHDKPEDEGYDNTPASPQPKKPYNPNDFADVVNKVRDFDYTPPNSGSNPMKDKEEDKEDKKEEAILQSFESQLFAEYKKFVSEGKKGHAKSCKCKECVSMEGAKPDFLDLDNDDNKKEPMKKAAKDKKVSERDEGKHNNGKTTGFKAVAKKAAKEYGSKKAGERVAGAVRAKMAKAGKL